MYSIIGGGQNNDISYSQYSIIGGGGDNNISNDSIFSIIGGGRSNDILDSSCLYISNGKNNSINITRQGIAIINGLENTINSISTSIEYGPLTYIGKQIVLLKKLMLQEEVMFAVGSGNIHIVFISINFRWHSIS